jgi:serine/threonine-protein kinase
VLLTAGGIFAAVASKGPDPKPSAAVPAAAPPNTVPFTGTYRVDYEPETDLDGKPVEDAAPLNTVTWGVRSVCRPAGCVATASRLGGESFVSGMVFDDVGGRWVAVVLVPDPCINPPAEFWAVFTLQPRTDGTLAGEWSMTSSGCRAFKRAVILTRTGDVDVDSLPDPASQPPRVVSPAEALRGRYHMTMTFRPATETAMSPTWLSVPTVFAPAIGA